MACVVAAACDLAMADAAFRASVSASGAGLGDSLTTIYHKAACQFPKDPEAQGLVTLMHCQLTRAEAAGLRVRASTYVICVSCICMTPHLVCCTMARTGGCAVYPILWHVPMITLCSGGTQWITCSSVRLPVTWPVQAGVADLHFRKHMLVLLESVVGPLPDWRRTAFWRENSFARAYERVQPLQEREAW